MNISIEAVARGDTVKTFLEKGFVARTLIESADVADLKEVHFLFLMMKRSTYIFKGLFYEDPRETTTLLLYGFCKSLAFAFFLWLNLTTLRLVSKSQKAVGSSHLLQ